MSNNTELKTLLESFDLNKTNSRTQNLHYFDYLIESLPKNFEFEFIISNSEPLFVFKINEILFKPKISFDREIESYSISPLFLNNYFNVNFDDDNEFGHASKLFTINSRIDAIFNYLQYPNSES